MCTKPLRHFAVIGHPIGHTMSPFIHERLFALAQKEPSEYLALDIPPQDLESAMETLRGLEGFNVTIPHKEAILPLLDQLSPQARAFGSVNTVCTREGVSTGSTTDGIGCLKALEAAGVTPEGPCLLLGSGGAARAIAFALTESVPAPQLTFAVREGSVEKARALCASLSQYAASLGKTGAYTVCTYGQLETGTARFRLLLNCTSVGMYPNIQACPVSEKVVGRCEAVFDAVYNPHETRLLQTAQKLHLPAIHGMAMLVWQAVAAHQIWDGSEYRPEDIQQLIQDAAEEMARRFQEGEA